MYQRVCEESSILSLQKTHKQNQRGLFLLYQYIAYITMLLNYNQDKLDTLKVKNMIYRFQCPDKPTKGWRGNAAPVSF